MSAEEFWEGDPRLVVAYRKAERIRRENRYLAEWRAGVYVGKAVGAVLSEKAKYPDRPIFSVEQDEQTEREGRERARMEEMMRRFAVMAAGVNRRMAAKQGD